MAPLPTLKWGLIGMDGVVSARRARKTRERNSMIFVETGQNNPIQGAQPHPNTIVRPRRETRLSTERAIVLASVPQPTSRHFHGVCRRDNRGPGGYLTGTSKPVITVIIGGRALLMLIAARFSGPGSGKDLLSRAISLIACGLLPFSSFPIPVAPNSYRGRDRPACRIPCARRGMAHRVRPQ